MKRLPLLNFSSGYLCADWNGHNQMRRHEQLWLDQPWIAQPHAQERAAISQILDSNPAIAEAVAQDLTRRLKNPVTGKPGTSGDKVLRVIVLKQMKSWSYEDVHFHLLDSSTFRTFCRLEAPGTVATRSTLKVSRSKARVIGVQRRQ